MKVVSFKICPFVQRVTALLEAKDVAYEIEYIDLGNKPRWFLDISPNAQVPILITDENQVLFESDAIVEYLDETAGAPLSSADPVIKAQDRAWSYLGSKNYLLQCGAQHSADAQTLDERATKLTSAFAKIEARLGDTRFASGDNLSMIDIAWLPIIHRTEIIKRYSGYDFLEGFSQMKQWRKNLLATGLAEKSVAKDFEERFTASYLAESTYLGQLARINGKAFCCGSTDCTIDDMACCA